jgi:hypothetical protein
MIGSTPYRRPSSCGACPVLLASFYGLVDLKTEIVWAISGPTGTS